MLLCTYQNFKIWWFLLGGKIIHVDKLEVWKKALSTAKKENPDGFKNGGQVFGVSLLLGYMCLLHGMFIQK